MAQWVECMLALSQSGETIFINLDNVATMRKHSQGTSITFGWFAGKHLFGERKPARDYK